MDAVIICVPTDYEWAAALNEQLVTRGYRVYLESPDVDAKTRQKTVAAMREAYAMVAVVSTEAALGDSAEVFEAWWRPFADNQRDVIPCLPANAPKGAKNWMPYDLYQHNPIDFAEPSAFSALTKRLGKPKTTPMPAPPAISLPALPLDPEQPNIAPIPTAPPPPPLQPESYPDVPDLVTQPPQMGLFNYLSSVVIGFVLVAIIWGAALQSNTSLVGWLVGIGVVIGALFALGRIEVGRRQEQQWLALRWQRAQQLGASLSRPNVYVEILDSPHLDEQQSVWDFYGIELSIGQVAEATIPLWRYKGLDAELCVIVYEDGYYILENTSKSRIIMVVGQPLSPQMTMAIHNGDLITLPDIGLVFQFRHSSQADES